MSKRQSLFKSTLWVTVFVILAVSMLRALSVPLLAGPSLGLPGHDWCMVGQYNDSAAGDEDSSLPDTTLSAHCPFCRIGLDVWLLPPPQRKLPLLVPSPAILSVLFADALPRDRFDLPIQARAPPLFLG